MPDRTPMPTAAAPSGPPERSPPSTCLGIDFSGAAQPWRPRAKRPSVWIATLDGFDRPCLRSLMPAQHLPGDGPPFERLRTELARGAFAACAIDAPFSLPADHLPGGSQAGLLDAVRRLPDAVDRPFPRGAALVELAAAVSPLRSAKPLRACERLWQSRRVNARSTLWNGRARPGAPFAVACLALLARAGRPCWPWSANPDGLLVEAFPAAQLHTWGLPHTGYSKPEAEPARTGIVGALRDRVLVDAADADAMIRSPDALDATLAAFAALAVATGRVAVPPPGGDGMEEGWIAVHA